MLWPLLWANTCCSHPREGETIPEAATRRLQEELGFTCPLQEHSTYVYRAEDPGRGVEHEHVTIVIGEADKDVAPHPDPAEIAEWKWVPVAGLRTDMERHPEDFAPWFPIGLHTILSP
jgi:isopentenyl-diphosphate delta-isomerase